MRGKFITVEGQDGAGKSTNIGVVQRFLEHKSIDFVVSREPGGTSFGESLRELLLNSGENEVGDMAELLMMFAARAQHIEDVIEPALSSGKWVICDRFTDATYAYQGAGRGLKLSNISKLEYVVQGGLRPDLTILLDLPVVLGEQRAGQRSDPDRFEQQKIDFKQRVRDCYLQRAEVEPCRIKTVDASRSIEHVDASIVQILQEFV